MVRAIGRPKCFFLGAGGLLNVSLGNTPVMWLCDVPALALNCLGMYCTWQCHVVVIDTGCNVFIQNRGVVMGHEPVESIMFQRSSVVLNSGRKCSTISKCLDRFFTATSPKAFQKSGLLSVELR